MAGKTIIVNNLEEAKRWHPETKPQHLPIKVCRRENGVAFLVISKSGHVLRRS